MRVLLLISLLFFTACRYETKFKVGDCVKSKDEFKLERWQEPSKVSKIVEIGRHEYRYKFVSPYNAHIIETDFEIDGIDRIKEKTDCTTELKDVE